MRRRHVKPRSARPLWIPIAVLVSTLAVTSTFVGVRLTDSWADSDIVSSEAGGAGANDRPTSGSDSQQDGVFAPIPTPSWPPSASPSPWPSTSPTPSPSRTSKPKPDPTPSPSRTPKPDPKPADGTLCAASFLPENGESSTGALARADERYGGLEAVRVFYTEPDPWPESRAGTPGRPVIVSLKLNPEDVNAGKHDASVRNWFRTAPRDRDIYWSLHHEPEDNVDQGEFDTGEYRTAWRRLAKLADASGSPRLYATLILMDWTLDSRSGRNWRSFYAGDDVIDVLGFDVYNHGWKQDTPTYYSAEKQLSTIVATARRVGKPFGIAELGSVRIPGDAAGTGRARWLRNMTAYLERHDALWAAYYDIDYDGDSDYRLRDTASVAAWREFCSR